MNHKSFKMKNLILPFLFLCTATFVFSQSVAINTDGTTAHASSILEVKSTTKGMLVPRMTIAQRNAIAAPATGLLVYVTDDNSFYFYNGGWKSMKTARELADADGDTKIQVEEAANDNTLRFDISGDERVKMTETANGILTVDFNSYGSNLFLGNTAGQNTTNGISNTGIGLFALANNSTGGNNTALGYHAMNQNIDGHLNAAFGHSSLYSNTSGNNNVAIGYASLSASTNGNYNSAIGIDALNLLTSGDNNTSLGSYSGENVGTCNNCTFLGAHASASQDGFTNSTAIGYDTHVNDNNKIRVGNTSVASIGGAVAWTNFSDARFKTGVREDVPGLAFITKLRPVSYVFDLPKLSRFIGEKEMPEPPAQEVRSTGFLAQEVEAAAKQLGFEFSGVDAPKNEDKDIYGLRYAEFSVPLVKAVQELDAENKLLKQQLALLIQRVNTLEARAVAEK